MYHTLIIHQKPRVLHLMVAHFLRRNTHLPPLGTSEPGFWRTLAAITRHSGPLLIHSVSSRQHRPCFVTLIEPWFDRRAVLEYRENFSYILQYRNCSEHLLLPISVSMLLYRAYQPIRYTLVNPLIYLIAGINAHERGSLSRSVKQQQDGQSSAISSPAITKYEIKIILMVPFESALFIEHFLGNCEFHNCFPITSAV